MLLSIIVPVYNMMAGGRLAQCMQSLLSQTLSDYEIIAVDDCSPDDSLSYLQSLAGKHPQLTVIASPENRKQGGARNIGLAAARGEWIGFVDSDDWVSTDMFAKLLAKAGETGADIVGCDYLLTDTVGKNEGQVVVNNTASQTGILDDAKLRELLLDPGSMVIKIYKRTLFTENQIVFPERMFYEDNAIAVLPFLYAKRFERVDEALYFYLQDASSTVHNVSIERCKNRMTAMEILKGELQKRGFYEKLHTECDYKIFELGYKNTLFSYLQSEKHPDKTFVAKLREYLLCHIPAFEMNPYIREHTDARTLQMAKLHRKGTGCFLLFYKLVQSYRSLRHAT